MRFLCQFEPCTYRTDSFKRLLRHSWDKHSLSRNFKYKCNISNCPRTYTNVQSFRRHLKSSHQWFYEINFGESDRNCVLQNELESDLEDINEEQENDNDNTENDYYEDDNSVNNIDHDEIVAHFLLELRETFNVTTECTCYISEKLKSMICQDRMWFNKAVKKSLVDNHNFELDYETDTILSSESLFSRSFAKFTGRKKLSEYIKSKPDFVNPNEIAIGFDAMKEKNDTIQYIPILETLNVILKHEDVLGTVITHKPSNDGRLNSFSDGSLCKANPLFSSHEVALQIVLYHDDFNVVNPLGNKVNKYKVSGFYFVIGNMPSKFKSRLKDIHLVLLSPAAFVKKYGYSAILEPLLDDLKNLERNGITVVLDNISHLIFGTLSMMVADNLAAHAVGGFFCNFSTVKRFCRFCMATRNKLNDVTAQFELRNEASYAAHINTVKADISLRSLYGLQADSCLNSLTYYHVTNGLPPDLAHDVFEGFAKDIMKNIITYLVKEKYITLKGLNERILTFSYCEIDKQNKPQIILEGPLSTLRVKQTASEMWRFLHLLPLFIGDFVPDECIHWQNYIAFLDVLDRLCAPSFCESELIILTAIINEFFKNYLELYPDQNLKPKAHFICHYPEMIRRFGPLNMTLRFESKNGQLKTFVNNNKNKKNLCQSLAKKHQMLMYLSYVEVSMLEMRDVKMVGSTEMALECLPATEKDAIIENDVMNENNMIIMAKATVFDGQRYSTSEGVLINFKEDEYVFGKILKIFMINTSVFLYCELLITIGYNSHYHAYEVESGNTKTLIDIKDLLDYHPLPIYRHDVKDFVIMRYHVPHKM